MQHPIYVSSGAFIGRVNGRSPTPFLQIAPSLRCDGFECMLYEAWYDRLDEVIEQFAMSKLSFPVLHVEKSIGTVIGVGESGYRKTALDLFEKNCQAAKRLSARTLVFHLWNGLASDHHFDRHLEICGEFLSMAEDYGLCLSVENVVCAEGSPLAHLLALSEAYPALAFTFDTKMASFHRELALAFDAPYRQLWHSIKHLHVNDHGGAYHDFSGLRTLHIGEGHIDFESFFEKLSEVGYHGGITLECTSMCEDGNLTPEKMAASIEKVRAYLKQEGQVKERQNMQSDEKN